MEDDILNTIESLSARATAKEEDANKLKKLVNELCGEAGIPIRYPTISQSGVTSPIRSDQFYGLPLTAAIRNYLEHRKACGLGAATIAEIHKAVRDGGYKFDTKNDDNARIGVGNAFAKRVRFFIDCPMVNLDCSTGIRQRTPLDVDAFLAAKRGRLAKKKAASKAEKSAGNSGPRVKDANAVTNKEIRDVILSQAGKFQSADIDKAIRAAFPGKTIPAPKIPTVIFLLKKKGLIEEVTPRSGMNGATYSGHGQKLLSA